MTSLQMHIAHYITDDGNDDDYDDVSSTCRLPLFYR